MLTFLFKRTLITAQKSKLKAQNPKEVFLLVQIEKAHWHKIKVKNAATSEAHVEQGKFEDRKVEKTLVVLYNTVVT